MKRTVALFLSIIIIIGLTACQNTESDSCDLPSGTYYMVGEFEESMTPYLALNFGDHTFRSFFPSYLGKKRKHKFDEYEFSQSPQINPPTRPVSSIPLQVPTRKSAGKPARSTSP